MDESRNCVFICGAGSSVPCGLPAMKRFLDYARRHYFALKANGADPCLAACFEQMFEFHAECRNAAWAFDRDWDNIEELYTQADLGRLARLPGKKALCDRIAWAMWEI